MKKPQVQVQTKKKLYEFLNSKISKKPKKFAKIDQIGIKSDRR